MNLRRLLGRAQESNLLVAIVNLASAAWCPLVDSAVAHGVARAWRIAGWRHRLKTFGAGSHIYSHVVIKNPSLVSIGARVNIADFVHIWGGGGITIGDDTLIAAHVVITTETHDVDAPVFRDTRI